MKETIKFTIAQDGTVTEEVLGIYGDACEKLTSDIEESLGAVYFKENNSDYYIQNNVALQHNQNQIKM